MRVSTFRESVYRMFVEAAGPDGNLSSTDAKKLGSFAAAKVAELRKDNPRLKISPDVAGRVVLGEPLTGWVEETPSSLSSLGDAWMAVEDRKNLGDISKPEISRLADPEIKALAERAYAYATANQPAPVIPTYVDMKRVGAAATLLEGLVARLDNEDEVLTIAELNKIQWAKDDPATPERTAPQFDGVTYDALAAAIYRKKSAADRSVTGIQGGIKEALAELRALDKNGDGKLAQDEHRKSISSLAGALLAFAQTHGAKKQSDFVFEKPEEQIYRPTRPFRAPPWNASGMTVVNALMKHFNAFSNDNGGGYTGARYTRIVLGKIETDGMLAEIHKLPGAQKKKTFEALSERILMRDSPGFDPQRIWIQPSAVAAVEAAAAKVGVTKSFRGDPVAPGYSYS